MAVAEELQIIIDAKVTQAVKNLKNVQKGLGDTGKKANKMGDIFKQLAGPLALGAVVAGAIRLGKSFSKAASDAAEIGSKYNTIFRDITGQANEMAESFANDFGLASSTSKELLGNTADLLTGLGFTQQGALDLSGQVNTLAADLASFSNFAGGTTGASEALTKALLGEAESAKALGIVINQNTKEYKDAIRFYTEVEGLTLLQAKAFTALQFATEQSGNAIGDVARTWNSTANVQRRVEESTKSLSEQYGVAVNEGLTPFLVILDKVISAEAQLVLKGNELREANRLFTEGTSTAEESVKALNDLLIGQVTATAALVDAQRLQIAGSAEALEAQKERIATTRRLLIEAGKMAAAEALTAKFTKEAAEAQADADAKAAQAAKIKAEELALLESFFKTTKEGQIEALELSIKEFETYVQTGDVLIVLRDLSQELLDLTGEEIAQVVTLGNVWEILNVEALNGITTVNDELDVQVDKIDEVKQAYLDLAGAGLRPLIDAFDNVGDAGANTWEVMKQAGKDAISGILKAFAEQWTVQAIAALASFNFASAGLYSAAAAGAVAASSVVQNFATGTSSFTANKPTPIMVGEGAMSEKVTVENASGNSGGSERVFATVDGDEGFWMTIQRGVNDRKLRIPQGNIV